MYNFAATICTDLRKENNLRECLQCLKKIVFTLNINHYFIVQNVCSTVITFPTKYFKHF